MNTGSALARFTITLSTAVTEPVQVEWHTSDGTAKATVDYAANNGIVVFAPGETAKTVDILVYGRAVGTEDRSFYVEMLPPTNAILGASIGECIITVDTSGSTPVTKIIVPTGPVGPHGKSAYQSYLDTTTDNPPKTETEWVESLKGDPAEIALEVAPLIDVGATVLTAEGTETLGKPDQTTVKAVARRVAYATPAKIATVVLADGDNSVGQSDMTGDTLDMSSEGLYPRIMRGSTVITPHWSIQSDGKILIKDSIAGDVLYVCQYDFISAKKLNTNTREQWRRSLAEAGLTLADGSFEEGATANSKTDAVWYIAEGQCYTWAGTLPKTVSAGSSPGETGGVGLGAWISVDDASLRSDLSANGDRITGSSYGGTIYSDYSKTLYTRRVTFAAGGSVSGPNDLAQASDGNWYAYKGASTFPVSIAPGSAPDSNWYSQGNAQRGYGVPVSVEQFITPEMDAAGDHTAAINAALNSGAPIVNFPARTIYWDGTPLIVKTGTTINAYGCTLKLKPGNYPGISTGITNRKNYSYGAGTPEHYDITVNGLVIDGNKANVTWDSTADTSTFNGFWFHQATRIKLTDCSVINAYGSRGGQPGIMFKFCTDVQVTRGHTYDTDRNGMAFYSTANFKVIGGTYQLSRWREPILMTSEDNPDGSPALQPASGVVLGAYCNNIGSIKGPYGMRASGSYDVYIGGGTRIYAQNSVETQDDPSTRIGTQGVILSMSPSNSPFTRRITLDGVYINGANTDINIENTGIIDAKILNVTSENVQNAISINTTNGENTFGVVKVENYTCTLTGVKTAPRVKNISEFLGRNIDIRNPATAFIIDNYGKFTIDNLRIDSLTVSSNVMNVTNPKTASVDWVSSISNYHGVNNPNNTINFDGKAFIATNLGLATTTGTGIPCMEFGSKFYLFKNASNQLVRKFGSPPTSLTDGTVIG